MKITHQISFRKTIQPKLFELLKDSGHSFNRSPLPNDELCSVLISEDDPSWQFFDKWTNRDGVFHSYETYFSNDEILEAEWLRVVNVFGYLYPEPRSTWATSPINYGNFCGGCGKYDLISPFHIRHEPRFRGNSFMSFEWVGGMLFTKPDIVKVLLENNITGFDVWPVILHNSSSEANTIQQIYTRVFTEFGLLDLNLLNYEICPVCGEKKYSYHRRGKMAYERTSFLQNVDILVAKEWFGAGHFAYHELFISRRLAKLVIENGWKGLSMKVVELR